MEFVASPDNPAGSEWTDLGGTEELYGGALDAVESGSSCPGLPFAVPFDGSTIATLSDFVEHLQPDPSEGPASFEVWLRSDNGTADAVIWETGGIDHGVSLTYRDGMVACRMRYDTNGQVDLAVDIAESAPEFEPFVCVWDPATYTGTLYRNGVEVDEAEFDTLGDWSGQDNTTLGGPADTVGGYEDYDQGQFEGDYLRGAVAKWTLYASALTADEVAALYAEADCPDPVVDTADTGAPADVDHDTAPADDGGDEVKNGTLGYEVGCGCGVGSPNPGVGMLLVGLLGLRRRAP